ncbi:DUF2194 domain-containing protein [Aneurinibacillus sp. REN35]|uniref:DUF2194 domain-containing protein n=1 Tax=Aneurinibacillus sp. REN35 TaxID=3237286 RepID=UPI003528508B
MKVRTMSILIFLAAIMLLLTAGLQFMRSNGAYKLFSLTSGPGEVVQTMSAPDKKEKGQTITISILDSYSTVDRPLLSNLEHALQYAKVDYERITVENLATLTPSPYQVLVLVGEQVNQWPYETIRSYVQHGGRLVVTTRFHDPKWNELVGIQESRGFFKKDVSGLTFNRPIFPGYPNIPPQSRLFINSILDVSLQAGADVYLSAEKKPLLWTYPYGEGKVVYWNASTLVDKNTRGLLLHSIGLALPAFVTGQVAAKAVYIDDFPAPWPEGSNKAIAAHYGMNTSEFFRKVWWTDMKRWAHEYNIAYTGLMIATYRDDHTLSSEELIQLDKDTMVFFGRQLLKLGGEIGIHGYNHESLVTKGEPNDTELGYKLWKDQNEMVRSLRSAQEVFTHYFPEESFTTYVPPSNLLGRTGTAAIHEALPHVNTISSIYAGAPGKGYLIQEFGADKRFPNLYHMPRITSGYRFDEETAFLQADSLANFGLFSHFIHPDDIIDPSRAFGRGWPDMRSDFARMLAHVQKTYPYVEPTTARKLEQRLKAYQSATVRVRYAPDRIYLSGDKLPSPSYFLLRIEEHKAVDTQTAQGAEITKMPGMDHLFLIKMTQPEAEIQLKGGAS